MADIIICVKFYRNRLRGRSCEGQNIGFSIDFVLTVAVATRQHYCAVCDVSNIMITGSTVDPILARQSPRPKSAKDEFSQ